MDSAPEISLVGSWYFCHNHFLFVGSANFETAETPGRHRKRDNIHVIPLADTLSVLVPPVCPLQVLLDDTSVTARATTRISLAFTLCQMDVSHLAGIMALFGHARTGHVGFDNSIAVQGLLDYVGHWHLVHAFVYLVSSLVEISAHGSARSS